MVQTSDESTSVYVRLTFGQSNESSVCWKLFMRRALDLPVIKHTPPNYIGLAIFTFRRRKEAGVQESRVMMLIGTER